jgi:hypothetical protein
MPYKRFRLLKGCPGVYFFSLRKVYRPETGFLCCQLERDIRKTKATTRIITFSTRLVFLQKEQFCSVVVFCISG